MTVTCGEKLGSGETQDGENPQTEKLYLIQGTSDETEALAKLASTAPTIYNDFVRQNLRVSPVDNTNDIWIGEVDYVSAAVAELGEGESEMVRFSIEGSPQHITQALTSESFVPAGKTATDFKQAVNVVDNDGIRTVEGVDINVSIYKWTERHIISAANMTEAYVKRLKLVANKVNENTFRNHPPYSVYFDSADGSKRSDGAWDVTFNFAHSENIEDQTIGTITGIDKNGWEYLWVSYKDEKDDDSGMMTKVPAQVEVDEVYYTADFAMLEPGYTPPPE